MDVSAMEAENAISAANISIGKKLVDGCKSCFLKDGVRFRAVVAKIGGGTTNVSTSLPSHTNFSDQIITFYFDRNLKDKMQFKNPQVEQYYQSNQHTRRKS